MYTIHRSRSDNSDFQSLVKKLDVDLKIRDGEDHSFFAQFNKTDLIKHCIVAYFQETPVGCGAIKHYNDHTMEVKRMFVEPEFRNKGIAGMILQELERWAKELGYLSCILETGIKQPEAIRLYSRSGYRLIPNYDPYIGVESSRCFEKQLLNY